MKKLLIFSIIFIFSFLTSTIKARADITSNLEAHWKMNESSWNGTSGEVVDSSGNGNNGTAQNGANTTNGKIDKGGSFDGTNDNVLVSDNSSIDLGLTDFTIAYWVKRTSNYTDVNRILLYKKDTGIDSSLGYGSAITYSGHSYGAYKPTFTLGDGTFSEAYYPTNSYDSIPLSKWMHVAFAYDVDTHTGTFYINGKAVPTTKSATGSVGSIDNSFNLNIGGGLGQVLPGIMDELRIYRRTLTVDDIEQLEYISFNADTDEHLLYYYKFNESSYNGTNDEIIDYSGNNFNGRTFNGATVAPGISGNAIDFDGINDYAYVGELETKPTLPATFTYWLRTETFPIGTAQVFDTSLTTNYTGFLGTGFIIRSCLFNNGKWRFTRLYI